MIVTALALGITGLALSALFSGSETGFYRQTPVRLLLDARAGSRVAQGLLALAHRPALFVATALVGNNVANYLVSLALVLATSVLAGSSVWMQLLAPVAFSPVVFIYGELLPKHVYFQAPNRLLRAWGPLLLALAILFGPLSAILWSVGWLLERLLGQSPQRVQSTLARRELVRVLDEGHDAGVLRPAQRQLIQGLFAVATEPVGPLAKPVARWPKLTTSVSRRVALDTAKRHRLAVLPLFADGRSEEPVGYVRTIDLALATGEQLPPLRTLVEARWDDAMIDTLLRMQNAGEQMALVSGLQTKQTRLVTTEALIEPLGRGGL